MRERRCALHACHHTLKALIMCASDTVAPLALSLPEKRVRMAY